jgi:hypothetical protein
MQAGRLHHENGGAFMVRKSLLTLLVVTALAASASAQTAPRHRWQAGQVLVYKTAHATQVIDIVEDAKVETKSQVNVTKRWRVADVDAQGVATLELSLLALRIEQTTPKGETLLFDSADPDKSDPDLRKQMSQFVGPTLAVLRLDAAGKLIEVKESKFGPASRFENELPFIVVLPPAMPQANQTWDRTYKIMQTDAFEAVQHYTCKAVTAAALTISLTTELKAPPAAAADRVPLLQLLPEGEVVFDVQAGRLHSAALKIDKELKGHNGDGSSYRFVSNYTEQYVGDR